MRRDKQEAAIGLPEIGVSLDELVRRGARQVIQQVIELELAALLEQYANVRTLAGKQAVVRNGYLPKRDVLTAAGPVAKSKCQRRVVFPGGSCILILTF
jgi:putative transposase